VGAGDRAAARVKVAYYSPLPPARSGIADYSALLLPALERRVDVVVVRRRSRRRQPRADVALYHIGNDPRHHWWIVEALRRRPGVVVLHDFVLHHLVAGLTLGRGRAEGYLDAMQREAGAVGRMLAHGVIDGVLPPLWETRPEEFPLTGEVLSAATGVIAHSAYVEQRVRAHAYAGPVWRVPHPAWPPPELAPTELPQGRTVIGCFGHLNPAKRLPELLEAYGRLRRHVPEALLLLVGSLSPGLELGPAYERLGLRPGEDVIRMDYVDETQLWSLLTACDVIVSLRSPTMGETSGSVIRAMTAGRPLVVSEVGWFAELPDEVALKVPVGEGEIEALADALDALARRPDRRREMAEAARALAAGEHDVERVAEAYAAALEEAAGSSAVTNAVLAEVARAAAETGLSANGPALDEIAAQLREVGPGR
jgi:glycosyltransferase involved in cell wall biosynthesis